MAENIDVAQAEAQPAQGSGLDHLPMRDEEGQLRHEFVEEVTRAIHAADRPLLCEVVAELHEADLGDLIAALEPDDRVTLVELTGTDFDFSALNEVDNSVREEILEELEPETVAEGVRELESHDAVELLKGSTRRTRKRFRKAAAVRARRAGAEPALSGELRRPADAVGVHRGAAGLDRGEAIDYMRDTPDLPDRFYEIYAVDSEKHWQGAVSLDTLLRARRPVPLAELIDENRRRVSVLDDQEEVARMFGKYNLVAAPVVDTTNRLVGVITIDDVVDVIEEEADEDLKALGGVSSQEELSDTVGPSRAPASTGCWSIWRPRFWHPPCSACSRASSRRWWRWRCWRRSWRARAATPRPRP